MIVDLNRLSLILIDDVVLYDHPTPIDSEPNPLARAADLTMPIIVDGVIVNSPAKAAIVSELDADIVVVNNVIVNVATCSGREVGGAHHPWAEVRVRIECLHMMVANDTVSKNIAT